ncbi:major royal jelly protein-domain-containing protein [Coniella lustricola]|uniref:Major royal jelly protein-domain-containing protein n=1 Tax=Coniella lustricola TaxID=2025994 RepID=A0A2T2ZYH3_9PEZI|nr:major royal jelly protein-domain-containing protein [Coniella lustricola]
MHPTSILSALALLPLTVLAAVDSRVNVAWSGDTPVNGVAYTDTGRLFLVYARVDGTAATGLPEVVEWINGTAVPYPDRQWNSFTAGENVTNKLVKVNAIRTGPDGNLWIVDTGAPYYGGQVTMPDGPKIVSVNTTTNQVQRVYHMGNVTKYDSLLDDIRFDTARGFAYLTDAGSSTGALIVMDLTTGNAVRLLEGTQSVTPFMPSSSRGNAMKSAAGVWHYVAADQLELSPDGTTLYYQVSAGGMFRIDTDVLANSFYNSTLASILDDYVEPYALTPCTGGTAIDADGNIYVSDTDRLLIEKIYPNGTRTTLVQDDRLLWVDAMWIDSQQRLWMPASQLDRGQMYFADGEDRIELPVSVYTIDIGVGPSPIDHA